MKSKKEEERKEKKKEEKKKRKKKEEKSKMYGFLWVFMDYFGYLYRFLWICMEKNQTINPFLMSLDLKEPYLVYWLCFGLELVDCNPQLMNICIKEIFGF